MQVNIFFAGSRPYHAGQYQGGRPIPSNRRPVDSHVVKGATTPPQELTRQEELLTEDVYNTNRPDETGGNHGKKQEVPQFVLEENEFEPSQSSRFTSGRFKLFVN